MFSPLIKNIALLFQLLICNQSIVIANSDMINISSGKIIDSVKCCKHPSFSYAIYLPSKYNKQSKWPVIYIFDPAARGSSGVQCFMQAAEKYGYILACSNNSRNGDMKLSIEAAYNMFEDVELRFSLDFRRIYTSGFSGGSRVASFIALNSEKIAGVIGCGAGFPALDFSLITNFKSFSYVGIVGFKDMNYHEMLDLEKEITKLGATTVILRFDGGHRKPDADIVDIAVGWIQLQAMHKGFLPENDTLLNSLFEKWNLSLKEFKTQKDWASAANYYKYLIEYFPTFSNTLHYKEKLDSLITSKYYKKALREWENSRTEEIASIALLMNSSKDIIEAESVPDSIMHQWNTRIANLRSLTSAKNIQVQRMAARVLNMLWISGNMQTTNMFESKQYAKAITAIQLTLAIEPENCYTYYQLACAYAYNKEFKKSVKFLKKTVELGFKNKKAIENEAAFVPLRNDKLFQSIIAKLE